MNLVWTGQFKKDYKRVKKQGKTLADLRSVIEKLAGRIPLRHQLNTNNSELKTDICPRLKQVRPLLDVPSQNADIQLPTT